MRSDAACFSLLPQKCRRFIKKETCHTVLRAIYLPTMTAGDTREPCLLVFIDMSEGKVTNWTSALVNDLIGCDGGAGYALQI